VSISRVVAVAARLDDRLSLLPALLVTSRLLSEGVEEHRIAPEPCAFAAGHGEDPYALAEPRSIEHRVTIGEHITDVAVRYGVDPKEVVRDNGLDAWRRRLWPGKKLRILARRLPPPRERNVVRVEPGDTWTSLAIAHRVSTRLLKAYNWKKRRLRPGMEIVVWTDPGRPRTVRAPVEDPSRPSYEPPSGGVSVGRPQRGRIEQPIALPESRCYTRGKPERIWGSSHTIVELQRAVARLRYDAGYRGELVIGAISREGGGRFPPHRSHQSGRDVDTRLPLLPGFALRRAPHPDEVDWPAAWALVRALVDGGQVQVVFLESKLQRRLYEAARWEGESHERLGELLQVLDPERYGTIVRHSHGHDGHLHVRFRCGPADTDCRG
jgi:hypothetical protein